MDDPVQITWDRFLPHYPLSQTILMGVIVMSIVVSLIKQEPLTIFAVWVANCRLPRYSKRGKVCRYYYRYENMVWYYYLYENMVWYYFRFYQW